MPILLGVLFALTLLFPMSVFAEPKPRIRSISIRVIDVFEQDGGGLYRAANSLKVNTREHVVRQELRFHEGEEYDQFKVDESARFLRILPFFRRVSITPKFDGEWVDLVVEVQDQWTLIPQLSFNIGGGPNDNQTIGVIERNLLGYGKRLETVYGKDEGREKVEAVWDDLRVLGTDHRFFTSFFDRSDGWSSDGLVGRPFRSLTDPYSWGSAWDFSDTIGRLFVLGDERYIFRQEHHEMNARYVTAFGDPSENLTRIGFGYGYSRDTFHQATASDYDDIDVDPAEVSNDPDLLPTRRQFSGPFISIDHIHAQFISLDHVDRFDIVQDFNLGTEYSTKIHLASDALGSEGDTLLYTGSVRSGLRLGEREFGRGELGGSIRLNDDGFNNGFLRAEEKYFNVLGPQFLWGHYVGQHTLAAQITLEYGHDFDRDRQLLLGAENGLRGYESRTFEGDKRFVLNLEDRVTLVEDIFDLVSLGGVVFADVGGTTYDELGELVKNQIYSNIGIGLRIGFPRSSGGGVVRIDLAVPLRDPPQEGDDAYEPRLTISTGQLFTGRMATEQYGLEKANVSVGLAR